MSVRFCRRHEATATGAVSPAPPAAVEKGAAEAFARAAAAADDVARTVASDGGGGAPGTGRAGVRRGEGCHGIGHFLQCPVLAGAPGCKSPQASLLRPHRLHRQSAMPADQDPPSLSSFLLGSTLWSSLPSPGVEYVRQARYEPKARRPSAFACPPSRVDTRIGAMSERLRRRLRSRLDEVLMR